MWNYARLIETAEFHAGLYAASGNETARKQCLRIVRYLCRRYAPGKPEEVIREWILSGR